MNYLAHLHLADIAGLPFSGAVLGDIVRGRLEDRFPAPLERSIRLHRRIDVVTDAHPLIALARSRFEPGLRRHAGIVLDLLYDHCLALDWPRQESLENFAARAARAVSDEADWRLAAGKPAPAVAHFENLLLSYRDQAGIDRTIGRVASRLSKPQRLHDAAHEWRTHIPPLRLEFPTLLIDLEQIARDFVGLR